MYGKTLYGDLSLEWTTARDIWRFCGYGSNGEPFLLTGAADVNIGAGGVDTSHQRVAVSRDRGALLNQGSLRRGSPSRAGAWL